MCIKLFNFCLSLTEINTDLNVVYIHKEIQTKVHIKCISNSLVSPHLVQREAMNHYPFGAVFSHSQGTHVRQEIPNLLIIYL